MENPSERLRWLVYGTEDWLTDLSLPEQNMTTYLRLLLP